MGVLELEDRLVPAAMQRRGEGGLGGVGPGKKPRAGTLVAEMEHGAVRRFASGKASVHVEAGEEYRAVGRLADGESAVVDGDIDDGGVGGVVGFGGNKNDAGDGAGDAGEAGDVGGLGSIDDGGAPRHRHGALEHHVIGGLVGGKYGAAEEGIDRKGGGVMGFGGRQGGFDAG